MKTITQEITDDFCQSYEGEKVSYIDIFSRLVAGDNLPGVKAIIAKCKLANPK